MSLTVLSGGVANSPSSISISLTSMAGTFLLYVFFLFLFGLNKHFCSSNTNPHRAAEKKKTLELTTGQKKGSGEMHFPALSRKKIDILGWLEGALENVKI